MMGGWDNLHWPCPSFRAQDVDALAHLCPHRGALAHSLRLENPGMPNESGWMWGQEDLAVGPTYHSTAARAGGAGLLRNLHTTNGGRHQSWSLPNA